MARKYRRKIRSITIIGRRWFERVNGNTYFSADILVNGEHVHRIPFEYGYGDFYAQAAFQWLDENGYTADRKRHEWGGRESAWGYCSDRGIAYFKTAADVARKKDL